MVAEIMTKREYLKNYHSNRYEQRLKIAREILGSVCRCCGGYSDEFHHLGDKFKNVTSLTRNKLSVFIKELRKCIPICSECHSFFHLPILIHGSKRGYDRGCRCKRCREAQRISVAEWRKGCVSGKWNPRGL